MTELELRQQVCDKILSWMGFKQSDGSYQYILNLYNSHKPLARGYAIRTGDAWCACTVSAVAIACGLTDIMPTEVSCPQMIQLYQKHPLSRWEESDSYRPKIGDIIMYDWQDSGNGDDKGTADHVGIVTATSGNVLTIIEGNMGGKVGTRQISVNARYIRGYCLPNYAWKAGQATDPVLKKDRWETVDDIDDSWFKLTVQKWVDDGYLSGTGFKNGKPIIDLSRDMARCIAVNERITHDLIQKALGAKK